MTRYASRESPCTNTEICQSETHGTLGVCFSEAIPESEIRFGRKNLHWKRAFDAGRWKKLKCLYFIFNRASRDSLCERSRVINRHDTAVSSSKTIPFCVHLCTREGNTDPFELFPSWQCLFPTSLSIILSIVYSRTRWNGVAIFGGHFE